MGKYEILRYRPEHRDGLLQLHRELWSSDLALNDAYFRWEYESNPYDSEVEVYVAAHRGRVVGTRGFPGSRWEAGIPRREFAVVCAEDLVIAPAHRDRGLFTALMRASLADVAARRPEVGLALSLSGGPITVVGQRAMGWNSLGSLEPVALRSPRYRRIRRWRYRLSQVRFLWRFSRSRWLNLPCRFDRLDLHAAAGRLGGVRVTAVAEVGAMAELLTSLAHDGRVRHVRDARYFGWRFRNPLREYRFLYAGGPRLDGYLVLSRSLSDRDLNPPVQVADWEARTPEVARALFDAALTGEFPAVAAWIAALPREMGQVLKEKGFVPAEQARTGRGARCALALPLRNGANETEWALRGTASFAPENWDLRMLYSMVC
ncbi:MAG: hypothetical protein ACT4PM_00540 [Gemmatimonadales bacterium]